MRFSKKVTLHYQPLGVVGLITPWNGPVALAANPLAQALMAGNAVVHKPSEVTPFSAVLLKELADKAGLPKDLYQVIQGDGQTGAALIEAGVDKVSFTGSVATGRKVGEACGRNLIPVTLELGGKDAMIVCQDADLDRAADGAVRGSFFNTGHYCCGTERVYVPESIYEPFVEKVVAQAKTLKQAESGASDVGAVFWDKQMDIIEDHMADAKEKGAKVLVGGERNRSLSGYFFPPTVVVDVDHEMDLMRRETFGPIVAIQKVRDEEEAIELANDSRLRPLGQRLDDRSREGRADRRAHGDGQRQRERHRRHLRDSRGALRRRQGERRRAGQRRGRHPRLLPRASGDRGSLEEEGARWLPVYGRECRGASQAREERLRQQDPAQALRLAPTRSPAIGRTA